MSEGRRNCSKTPTEATVWGPFTSLLSSCGTIYCILDLCQDTGKLLVARHIPALETLLPDASRAALLTAAGDLTACQVLHVLRSVAKTRQRRVSAALLGLEKLPVEELVMGSDACLERAQV